MNCNKLSFTCFVFPLIQQITDFGLSITMSGVGHDNMMQDFCGTPNYMGKLLLYVYTVIHNTRKSIFNSL